MKDTSKIQPRPNPNYPVRPLLVLFDGPSSGPPFCQNFNENANQFCPPAPLLNQAECGGKLFRREFYLRLRALSATHVSLHMVAILYFLLVRLVRFIQVGFLGSTKVRIEDSRLRNKLKQTRF